MTIVACRRTLDEGLRLKNTSGECDLVCRVGEICDSGLQSGLQTGRQGGESAPSENASTKSLNLSAQSINDLSYIASSKSLNGLSVADGSAYRDER